MSSHFSAFSAFPCQSLVPYSPSPPSDLSNEEIAEELFRNTLNRSASLERKLLDTVRDRFEHPVVHGGDPVISPQRKVCFFTKKILQREKTSKESLERPTYAYAKLKTHPSGGELPIVKELVKVIYEEPDEQRAELALYALKQLESLDPTIRLVRGKASQYMREDRMDRLVLLRDYLRHFIEEEQGLRLECPIRPAKYHCMIPVSRAPVHPFWVIQAVCVGCSESRQMDSFKQNLKEVGSQERFRVFKEELRNPDLTWLCDPMITVNKKVLVPQSLTSTDEFSLLCNVITDSDLLLMGAVSDSRTAEHLAFHFPKIVEQAGFYFEGGNLLEAVNRNGRKVFLSGPNNLLFSLLNFAKTFNSKERADLIKKAEQLSAKDLETAEKIELRLWDYDRLEDWPSETIKLLARCFCAAVPALNDRMVKTLGAPVVVLGDVFEAQPEFHIDMFLCPAPGGKVFLNDYKLSIHKIDRVLERSDLSDQDIERLRTYRRQATECDDTLSEQLAEIEKQLLEANFEVIKVAGLFYDEDFHVAINYMNSIMGQNKRGTYCITNGSLHQADQFLKEEFIQDMQRNGIRHIYFTGRSSQGVISSKGGFPHLAADKSLRKSGGVHCRVQVLRGKLDYGFVYKMLSEMPGQFFPGDLGRETSAFLDLEEVILHEFPKDKGFPERTLSLPPVLAEIFSPRPISVLSGTSVDSAPVSSSPEYGTPQGGYATSSGSSSFSASPYFFKTEEKR